VQGDDRGAALAQELTEEILGIVTALLAGTPDRHQDGLGLGANAGAIAAPDSAQDHPETDGQLARLIGGILAGELGAL